MPQSQLLAALAGDNEPLLTYQGNEAMALRRISVRRSDVHGKGVFANVRISEGELIGEYKGRRIPWREAMERAPANLNEPDHTFFFDVGDGTVIDGGTQGNSARWINHSCEPNCEPEEDSGRIYIRALRTIESGEELSIDYALAGDEPPSKALRERYACRCGSRRCRGTMLANRRSR